MNNTTNPLWLEDCRKAYLETALWADWPEGQSPRTIYQSTRPTWEQALQDIQAFCAECEKVSINPTTFPAKDVGGNLWLSRNGHGTGFWDTTARGEWSEAAGDAMHDIAKAMGTRYPYSIPFGRWAIK